MVSGLVGSEAGLRHKGNAGIFFCLLFGLLISHGEVSAGDAVARISAVKGDVKRKTPGDEKGVSCRAGETISVGDLLSTGPGSGVQLVMTDDSVIDLSSSTRLRVNQYSFDSSKERRTANIKVLEGMARFIVYKELRESRFMVETEAAQTSFSSSDLVVRTALDSTTIAVLHGSAVVRNALKFIIGDVNLSDNQVTVVKSKTPPSQPSIITAQQRRILLKDAKNF